MASLGICFFICLNNVQSKMVRECVCSLYYQLFNRDLFWIVFFLNEIKEKREQRKWSIVWIEKRECTKWCWILVIVNFLLTRRSIYFCIFFFNDDDDDNHKTAITYIFSLSLSISFQWSIWIVYSIISFWSKLHCCTFFNRSYTLF